MCNHQLSKINVHWKNFRSGSARLGGFRVPKSACTSCTRAYVLERDSLF